ncbi:hypothetical protein SISNIDRAFT_469450 [Sistotremastrum niveocremeum HHB9708]|uniref:Uncharacterized protein n=1 Tax=Sistotremastrum niveocremeum HHB9708 TaxID=1314777 RepID=A0A164Q8L6_9AGAM|nr:hypothetical protein SISNIDRAFT_469450 [Sistotremastrum niveocremeum HHB9708]
MPSGSTITDDSQGDISLDRLIVNQLLGFEQHAVLDPSCSLRERNIEDYQWSTVEHCVLGAPSHVVFGSDGRRITFKFVGFIGPQSQISVYGDNIHRSSIDEHGIKTQQIHLAIHPLGYSNPLVSLWNRRDVWWLGRLQERFFKLMGVAGGIIEPFIQEPLDSAEDSTIHVFGSSFTPVDDRWKNERRLYGTTRSALKHGDGTIASLPDPAGKFQTLTLEQRRNFRPVVHRVFTTDKTLADPADYGRLLPIGMPVMVEAEPFVQVSFFNIYAISDEKCRLHILAPKPTSIHPSLHPSQIHLFSSPNVLPVVVAWEGGGCVGWWLDEVLVESRVHELSSKCKVCCLFAFEVLGSKRRRASLYPAGGGYGLSGFPRVPGMASEILADIHIRGCIPVENLTVEPQPTKNATKRNGVPEHASHNESSEDKPAKVVSAKKRKGNPVEINDQQEAYVDYRYRENTRYKLRKRMLVGGGLAGNELKSVCRYELQRLAGKSGRARSLEAKWKASRTVVLRRGFPRNGCDSGDSGIADERIGGN